uniref:Uncharacterized protein n=1 Tax=Avena sativa TaxID=4498 RepID=A0ACD5VAQ4_AVESA
MGNCFTNTATQNIVLQITPPPPPADGEHGKPAEPKPSGRPPLLPNPLPGSTPACGVVGWSMLDVWSLYILERELWSGQFWTAYLCTERATGLKYVCKSASKLPGAYVVGYMRREAAILQRLSGQPNVAKFRAAFEDANSVHLVMEFCSGGELFDRVTAKGSYPERQAAAVCRDVLTVVHVCHSMGVMHRDLRPENFRLASSAQGAPLKATDFGLSVFIEEGKVYKDIVGSAYYVAPEVLHGNYGREIDVWSAGVILYILLCGWPPFWAETEKGILDAILAGQVDLHSSPWPTISESAKDLTRQMLNRDPHKRITAAQALEHPWLKEGDGSSDKPTDSAVLLGMNQLKETNKLKRQPLKETAEDLPPEEAKGLKQMMFDNMDTDKSGTITPEELKISLTKLGSKIGKPEVQKLMEATVEDLPPEETNGLKQMMFDNIDIDKSGTITPEEPKISLTKLGSKIGEAEVQKLTEAETAEDLPPEEAKGLKQMMFDNMDTDKSGTITPEELKISLTKLGSKIGEAEVQQLTEAVGVEKSGSINDTEFLPAMVNKHKVEKEEDLSAASQYIDKENNGEHGEKYASRVSKRRKSSGQKNDKKESEQELNKPVSDNVVMIEVPSSQAELDKKLEEDLRKKMLSEKLDGGSGVDSSGNDEQHVQQNSMQEIDFGVGNTEREANNYIYQDKNHVEVEDVIDDKHTQQIQGMNQHTVIDTNESSSGTSTGGRDREEVNSTQGIARIDKENFVYEATRKSGRTDIHISEDDGQVSGKD